MRHRRMALGFALAGAMMVAGWTPASAHGGASGDLADETPGLFAAGAVNRDIVYETHLHCLALALYFEGGSTGETEEGQRHVARVVIERARANRRIWGGSDLCNVVFYKRAGVCQFSFACLPLARRTPKENAAWRFSLRIARDELEGRSEIGERLIRYYMNAALTPARNICRFRKEFVPVVQAGRHEFFREPTSEERVRLRQSEPAACKQAAQAKKRAAKHAGKKAAKHRQASLKKAIKAKRQKFARR
ncbi:MAG: cell wall hydrolase [Pseudorhodoplanes sp.]